MKGHIALIGMSGSGKTTVGKRLAKALDKPFFDTDEQIELSHGMSISSIFQTMGEEQFRIWETETIERLLAFPKESVLALGGGAVERNGDALAKSAHVIYLQRSIPSILKTLNPTSRPLLEANPEDALLAQLSARGDLYISTADLMVYNEAEPERCVAMILNALQ
jgi:shikimate kinase